MMSLITGGFFVRKHNWFLSHLWSLLVFAIACGTLYFYQLGMIIVPLVLKHQHPGISKTALHALLHNYDPLIAGITVALAAIQIAALLWLYRRQLRKANPLGIRKRPLRLESVFFIFTMYAIVLAMNVLTQRFGTPQNQTEVIDSMKIMPWTLFLLAGFLGPVIEELIFRGIFMNLFWKKDTPANGMLAIVCSSLVFGLMHEPHLSVFLVLYTSLGMVLAFTYRYHRDLRYSLALHMLINLPSALAILIQVLVH
jgi:membrane protease YdiL (CAAX protease family)